MKGDFSRFELDGDAFSRVLMQQGRVMVDSDWNDQAAILVRSQRMLAADLIGPHGGPADPPGPGFAIAKAPGNEPDLTIGVGTYYVDGIRCVNPGPPGGGPNASFRYSTQPFLPADQVTLPVDPPYLVYLDVWERHVTALEDPEIREVALGGPDTTTRTQVVWQVKADKFALPNFKGCSDFPLADFRARLAGTPPLLTAKAKEPDDVSDDPCLSTPDARFRGQENQLYRVEIHAVDGDAVTFVWSRENGSVVVPWLGTDGDDLRVAGIRDKVRGFGPGDWVELTHDGLELGAHAGVLARLVKADGEILTMDRTTATGPISADPTNLPNAKVRRWDQRDHPINPLAGGAVTVVTGTGDLHWIDLEDGIQVQFQPPSPPPGGGAPAKTDFRVGDYWAFPARLALGDIVWPQAAGTPVALPPHGVEHHYAPLAFVPAANVAAAAVVDLRKQFASLSKCVK